MRSRFKSPIAIFVIAFGVIFSVLLLIIGVTVLIVTREKEEKGQKKVETFSSCQALVDRLNENYQNYKYYDAIPLEGDMMTQNESVKAPSVAPATGAGDYSTTNVQVAGVDEADVIKTDGKYIYALWDGRLYIIDANTNEIISSTKTKGEPQEMFLNGDKIVVYSTSMQTVYPYMYNESSWGNTEKVGIFIYDISDISLPKLEREVTLDGGYKTARMIGDYVYLVSNYYFYPYQKVTVDDLDEIIPKYKTGTDSTEEKLAECNDISVFGDTGTNFVSVIGVSIKENDFSKKVILGNAETVYMSTDNLYIAGTEYPKANDETSSSCGLFEGMMGDCIVPPTQTYTDVKTGIYGLSIDGLQIKSGSYGSVDGTLLNQFSLDENNGFLRVATTSYDYSNFNDKSNNIYVLDVNDLKEVGKLENLAVGEEIYAVRYIGNRAYMVTFKSIDPLFVIDLADPKNPEILGELKIPGYSDYLHPYDETHIIGVGKSAESISEEWALQQGLKVALFDVSDVKNPKEVDHVIIGDRGSDSAVLNDHKAFLFDKSKDGLLSLPVTVYEIDADSSYLKDLETSLNDVSLIYRLEENSGEVVVTVITSMEADTVENILKNSSNLENIERLQYGDHTFKIRAQIKDYDFQSWGVEKFRGFYVYNLSLTNGFDKKGTVQSEGSTYDYYYYYTNLTPRSLYINDNLYAFDNGYIKVNRLDNLEEVAKIELKEAY